MWAPTTGRAPRRTLFGVLKGVPNFCVSDGVAGSESQTDQSLLPSGADFLPLEHSPGVSCDVSCADPSESRLRLRQMSLSPVSGDVKLE
ncbi:hypothetical protein EYF80_059120 [Liparis tanakae]|uniref:Uncharacterized protein n=1 Tax=Liparis tanakae TaxID=230148 RepID=A0A4Z2EP56_9TELE|nr:hypothetical protein EYF80_059120 [Liparis tanakae]